MNEESGIREFGMNPSSETLPSSAFGIPHSEGAAVESRLAAVSGRIHFAALLLVLACCPFEAGYRPIGRFLWAIFTNLEAALFILGATWLFKLAVDPAARSRLLKLPLLLPIAALVGASIMSMLFGEFRSLGVQFIYRLLVGVMVYASTYEALRTKTRLLIALGTFVAAGAISAVLGLLEFAPNVDIQPFLKPFKPQPTTVGGMLRLSGSFEYANGAAMFFEMALPILLGFLALFGSQRFASMLFSQRRTAARWRGIILVLLLVGALLYTPALILTYSRAALGGLAVALAAIAAVALLRGRRESGPATRSVLAALAAVVGVAVVSSLFLFATQPMFRLRLTTENDRGWYGATLTAPPLPQLAAGEAVTVPVTLSNDGQMTWSATGVLPVHVSYHWLSPDGSVYLVFEGLRTQLPHDVSPGETLSVNAIVQAPPQPGDYRLQWDLVHESVTWFQGKQGMKADVASYHIDQGNAAESAQTPPDAMPPPLTLESTTDYSSVGRGQLWKVALEMFRAHPIVGVGPDGFRNLYGEYAGVAQWNKNIYTNNTYLEMFTDLGLLGGLAFLWLACLAMWKAARNVLREPVGPLWVVGLGACAALIAFFAHGVLDYFLFATPMYVSFWFIMAVATNWPAAQERADTVSVMEC
jgi:O-antigen ligase